MMMMMIDGSTNTKKKITQNNVRLSNPVLRGLRVSALWMLSLCILFCGAELTVMFYLLITAATMAQPVQAAMIHSW